MCGIVGYVGPRDAGPILLDGLARLEYRGYDSAGIALITPEGDLFVEKRAGKVAELRSALGDGTPPRRTRASGTRAGPPTGGPATSTRTRTSTAAVSCRSSTTASSRTSSSCAPSSTAAGHRLDSETDTEVIAHLVEEAYHGRRRRRPCARRCGRAVGAYALAVLHRGEPERLVGARMNVPAHRRARRRRDVPGLGRGRDPRPHAAGHVPRGGRRRRPRRRPASG